MNKKIVIIGGDSYIAKRFVISLPKQYIIRLFSRKETGQKNEEVLNDFFKIAEADLVGCDFLINFAAIVHQPNQKDQELYKRINTLLPIFLADLAVSVGIKHFIQMSSVAVYGYTNLINIDSKECPENIYGKTKLAADHALLKKKSLHFKVSIIRPPMVYGGGNSPGNLMRLLKYSLRGFPLPFKGIENKRDFIHVHNLTQCLNIIIETGIEGVIIPTDRRSVSTYEVLEIISQNTKNKIRLFRVPKFFLSIAEAIYPGLYSKLFSTLLVESNLSKEIFKPEKSIDDGIVEMMEHLKNEDKDFS
jgi:UDP-glucose 4-epimerase